MRILTITLKDNLAEAEINVVKAIKSILKTLPKENYKIKEKKLSINGYTEEFEKEIKQSIKEIENGEYFEFDSLDKAMEHLKNHKKPKQYE